MAANLALETFSFFVFRMPDGQVAYRVRGGHLRGVLTSPYPDQEGHKLQRPNSAFIQHTPHEEAQYTS